MEATTINQQPTYSIISFPSREISRKYEIYKNAIISKWLRSLKSNNDYFKLIDREAYFKVYPFYIETILQRPNAIIKVAVLSDDHDNLLGFSVIEGSTLHYIQVHKLQRRLGIGKSLMPKEFKYFTHITKNGLMLWPKYPLAKFNPFI